MVKAPKIKFSKWVPWHERDGLLNMHFPGIYMMAHFEKVPFGRASRLDPRIKYIGKTWNKDGLRKRLQKFNASAATGKKGHKGGVNYYEYRKGKGISDSLYVAVFPIAVNASEKVRNAFILYAERKLIWQFSAANEAPPICNKE